MTEPGHIIRTGFHLPRSVLPCTEIEVECCISSLRIIGNSENQDYDPKICCIDFVLQFLCAQSTQCIARFRGDSADTRGLAESRSFAARLGEREMVTPRGLPGLHSSSDFSPPFLAALRRFIA